MSNAPEGLRLGALMFPTDKGVQPIELAREVEARGYESLWFPEHSHIPTSRISPWGGRPGAPPLPEEYWRTHDQFAALAAAAAVTTKIQLGSGITLVAQRDPLWLAKEVATIDAFSNGRMQFGIGYGWNHEEMANHGVDIKRRRAVVREKVLACIELWTKDEASYQGEHVRFDASWSWPKPVQRPHPPIVLGASPTDLHFRHLVEYCDAWMPIVGRWPIDEAWVRLQQQCSDADRDPATMKLGIYAAPADAAQLTGLRDLGASFAALTLPPLDRNEALRTMDAHAALIAEFNT